MKAVIRRLHQLERRLAPQAEAESSLSQSLAAVIRERRRRRCEANGEPFEELPPLCVPLAPGKPLSIAETLRTAAREPAKSQCEFGSGEIAGVLSASLRAARFSWSARFGQEIRLTHSTTCSV